MKARLMIARISFRLIVMLTAQSCTTTLGDLPDFRIVKSDSKEISLPKYMRGKTLLLIHFDVDCKGCQDEAQMIVDHLDELGDVNIAFASIQEPERIDLFDEYFHLSEHPNIIVGQDKTESIPTHFKTYSTPLIALIDKQGRVRKVIAGEPEKDELVELINEIN